MCDKCHSGLLQIKMSPFDWLVCSLIDSIGNSLATRPFVAIKKAGLIESSVKNDAHCFQKYQALFDLDFKLSTNQSTEL